MNQPNSRIARLPRQALPQPELTTARFSFEFSAMEEVLLPAYAGSAWRGVLGHALKRTVCITREPHCENCLLWRSCVYPYVFETPPPLESAKMRRYKAAPHPYLIEPAVDAERSYAPGECLRLGLTLFGRRAIEQLPYFVHALARVEACGVGAGRGRLRLASVRQEREIGGNDWASIHHPGGVLEVLPAMRMNPPAMPANLEIEFLTPLRLAREGRNIRPERLRFGDLFGRLLRRISMLSYFHTETPHETDFAGLNHQAKTVPWSGHAFTWREWTRYSSRQQTTIKMGGIVGRAGLSLTEHEALWPYLWLGQWTHAGKGTSMGLGRYALRAASLREETAGL